MLESESEGGRTELDLTGEWRLDETYEFGQSTGRVELLQNGHLLSGFMSIHDTMDDGEAIVVEQSFIGTLRRRIVFLYGIDIHGIGDRVDDYELDQWIGTVESESMITGCSEDLVGTIGTFTMRRISGFDDTVVTDRQAAEAGVTSLPLVTRQGRDYYMAAIRELLRAGFTATEITRFCHDRPAFRPVCDKVSRYAGLDDIIDQVIIHCEKRDLFDELLLEVKEINPHQYTRFEGTLFL